MVVTAYAMTVDTMPTSNDKSCRRRPLERGGPERYELQQVVVRRRTITLRGEQVDMGSGNSCSNGWCTIPANIQAGIQRHRKSLRSSTTRS